MEISNREETLISGWEWDLADDGTGASPSLITDSNALHLGVLHLVPSLQVFPLLALPAKYTADTIDMQDAGTRSYWIDIFKRHQPNVVEKALASCQSDPANVETEEQLHTRAQVRSTLV